MDYRKKKLWQIIEDYTKPVGKFVESIENDPDTPRWAKERLRKGFEEMKEKLRKKYRECVRDLP